MLLKQNLLATAILFAAIQCILCFEDTPRSYLKDKKMTSLLCNTCSKISTFMNETLHDPTKEFDVLLGFRLDKNGKKIRKDPSWARLFLKLNDVCEGWKDKHRVAKRRNGHLYLLTNEIVKDFDETSEFRKLKLEMEAKNRLFAKWAEQDVIDEANKENENYNDGKDDNKESDDDGDGGGDDDDDKEDEFMKAEKKFFHEKKPKLLKKRGKIHKQLNDICYFLSEKYADWLLGQQRIAKKMSDEKAVSDYLDPFAFCIEGDLCSEDMFNIKPELYKFKKDLKLPKKPVKPKEDIIETDYEEQMEDDLPETLEDFLKTDNDMNELARKFLPKDIKTQANEIASKILGKADKPEL